MSQQQWYSLAELMGLPGVPGTVDGMRGKAQREKWEGQPRRKKGGGREYNINSLPPVTRQALAKNQPAPATTAGQAGQQTGQKLALVEQTKKQAANRTIEAGLAATQTLHPREKQRDQARSSILGDWAAYRKTSGEAIRPSMKSYANYYNAGERSGMEAVRSLVPKISDRTLLRWRQTLKTTGHLGAGFGQRKGSGKIDSQPELAEFVIAMLTIYPHSKASQVIQALRSRFATRADLSLPSQGRVNSWMINWKKQSAQVFTALTNPDQWKNEYMAAFGSMSDHIIRLNQLWEFDGTPADVMFTDGRHSINGVIDVYSRRAKMFVTPTAKATAVAAIIRRALLDWGVPEVAKTDNGTDYTCFHVTRVITELGIEQDLCPPFSPWLKPHIERFFRTFAHDICELLPGFIGHNVADRNAIEARKAFSDRLYKKDQVIEINMTAAEFQTFADDWCNNIYHHNQHSGLNGKTPFQLHAEWNQPIRTIGNQRALDLLLAPAATKKGDGLCSVTKTGITIDKVNYLAAELWEYIGQQVRALEDPVDFGRIYVYGGEDFNQFVCIAESVHSGIDRAEVAARAKALQKETIQQKRRELKAAARTINITDVANEIMQHRALEAGKLLTLPKREQIYTSTGLEAAAEAAQATAVPDNSRLVERTEMLRQALAKAEAEQAELDAQQKPVAKLTDEQRYQHWLQLEATTSAGGKLNQTDSLFYSEFKQTAAFRTQQEMAAHFGDFYANQA